MREVADLNPPNAAPYIIAAHYMKAKNVNVFDAIHAGYCIRSTIISSDKVFDRLGLKRIALEKKRA